MKSAMTTGDPDDQAVALRDEHRPRKRLPAGANRVVRERLVAVHVRKARERRLALDLEVALRLVAARLANHALCARTAVPYAQISVHCGPISDVSNRIATIAFAPFDSASWTIRSITC